MEKFAAIVRIGDPDKHKTQEHVANVLSLHIETGCWSSPLQREVRQGMPVIASHIGAGQGQFLVGVFTGEPMSVPWPRAPEHADHVGHRVEWIDAVFVGDADAIPGAKGRSLRWLSTKEFNATLSKLRVADSALQRYRRCS